MAGQRWLKGHRASFLRTKAAEADYVGTAVSLKSPVSHYLIPPPSSIQSIKREKRREGITG
mgnify:CR=1 FL=1